MKNEYGLQKLVLINSARYGIAEIPLDDPVSLVGKNNSGKTSLINGLQYLLIRDRQQMDFYPHNNATSAKFYFPDNSSYILLEMQLRSGRVVIGCVGKGISNECQYFSYAGTLNAEDFKDTDGSIIKETELDEKLREKGISINRYRRSTDFFNNLYGRGEPGADDLDIRLFALTSPQLKDTFQQVLIKTLHLDRLEAKDVKKFILQINAVDYSKEASQNGFDFKKTWDEAFKSVDEDRVQFYACKNSLDCVETLRKKYDRARILRGKIGTMRDVINGGLARWEEYKNGELNRLNGLLNDIKNEQASLKQRHDDIIRENYGLGSEINKLDAADREYEALQTRFQLNPNRDVLENNVMAFYNQVAELQTQLNKAGTGNAKYVEGQIVRCKRSIDQMKRNLEGGDRLFKRRIQPLLPPENMDVLNGLVNAHILTMDAESMGDIEGFALSFSQYLASQGDVLNINGLTIERQAVAIHYEEQSSEQIAQDIKAANAELREYESQLAVLTDNAKANEKLAGLKSELENARKELELFDKYEQLRLSIAERNALRSELNVTLGRNGDELNDIESRQNELGERSKVLNNDLTKVSNDDSEISQARDKRLDIESFQDVLDLEHIIFEYNDDIMPHLKDALQEQFEDCKELGECSSSIKTYLLTLQQRGFTKYAGIEQQDELVERTIEFADCLDREEAQIQKNLKVAVTRVANVLRELENQFNYLERDVQDFNKLISKRPVSDLKKLSLELNTHDLLDAVRTIAKHGNGTEEAIELFHVDIKEGSAGDEEINKAKNLLIKYCNNQGSLKLADLFDLSFVVQKVDEAEMRYNDLKEIGSNGTVMMSKLIFGLALLYKMSDKKKMATSICYLDEAASIDEQNQKNLIDAAKEFGFNILFASPTPLTTVKYCIRIEKQNGWNHISNKQWIRLEDLSEESDD